MNSTPSIVNWSWALACLFLSGPAALAAELAGQAGRARSGPRAQAAKKVWEIIAHRGSSLDRPENTMASYRRAIEAGATATECDVRTTKDGFLVSLHDADIGRTSNGKGRLADHKLAELRQLDFGSWFDPKFKDERIPTIQEVLKLCHGKIDVLLDLQESRLIQTLAEISRRSRK